MQQKPSKEQSAKPIKYVSFHCWDRYGRHMVLSKMIAPTTAIYRSEFTHIHIILVWLGLHLEIVYLDLLNCCVPIVKDCITSGQIN